METPLCRICGRNFRTRLSPVCATSECKSAWRRHVTAKRSGRAAMERRRFEGMLKRNQGVTALALPSDSEDLSQSRFLTVSAPPKEGISNET